jgi:hypothetical protein
MNDDYASRKTYNKALAKIESLKKALKAKVDSVITDEVKQLRDELVAAQQLNDTLVKKLLKTKAELAAVEKTLWAVKKIVE